MQLETIWFYNLFTYILNSGWANAWFTYLNNLQVPTKGNVKFPQFHSNLFWNVYWIHLILHNFFFLLFQVSAFIFIKISRLTKVNYYKYFNWFLCKFYWINLNIQKMGFFGWGLYGYVKWVNENPFHMFQYLLGFVWWSLIHMHLENHKKHTVARISRRNVWKTSRLSLNIQFIIVSSVLSYISHRRKAKSSPKYYPSHMTVRSIKSLSD